MRILLLTLVPLLFACAFDHTNADIEDRPEIDVGTGATIIEPGQTAPGLPRRGTSSASTAPSGSAAGDAGDAGGTMLLGGAGGQASASARNRNTPLGPLTALLGYPFWIFGKSIHQQADRAVERRENGEPEGSRDESVRPPTMDERQQQRIANENEQMLRDLGAARQSGEAARTPSIQDELAALERSLGGTSATRAAAPMPRARDAVDRNGDGDPDLWVFVDDDARRREVLDEDHDGRPDHEHVYAADGRLERSNSDQDGDGRLESVTVFRGGEPQRKRADTDGDGTVDTWSFYVDGVLARHEVDRDADGFRDLILTYDAGKLSREEEDRNGDGRPDIVVRYDAGDPVQRDEDLDFDGVPDVQSYYQDGKLVRREVRSEELLERSPES